jgi:hypothetical protein
LLFAAPACYQLVKRKQLPMLSEWVWLVALMNFSVLGVVVDTVPRVPQMSVWGELAIYAFTFAIYVLSALALRIQKVSSAISVREKASTTVAYIFSVLYLFMIIVVFVPTEIIERNQYSVVGLALLTLFYTYLVTRNLKIPHMGIRVVAYIHYVLLYCFILSFDDVIVQSIAFALMTAHFIFWAVNKRMQTTMMVESRIIDVVYYLHINGFIAYLLYKYSQTLLDPIGLGYLQSLVTVLLVASFLLGLLKRFNRFYLPMFERAAIGLTIFVLDFVKLNGVPGVVLILVANILFIVLALLDTYRLVKESRFSLSAAIIVNTVFVLFSSSVLAYVNINFGYLNIIVDVVYGIVALLYIIIGLQRGLPLIRKIGLIFMLVVMAKLLLLDVPTAGLWQKFAAFLVFGLLALGISYLYQRALKRQKSNTD